MTRLIEMQDIVKSFTLNDCDVPVLKGVSLTIDAGDTLAIVGASGSGKSTLMNVMGLLERPDRGRYQLAGAWVSDLDDIALAACRNRMLGFVFQQFHLLPRFSAWENVALPLSYRIISKEAMELAVENALKAVGMLAYSQHLPLQLSGGQQQRIAIARALVSEPELILADEPTGALDSKTSAEILSLFLSLNQQGTTLIIVTHDESVARLCRRRIVMVDGHIEEMT